MITVVARWEDGYFGFLNGRVTEWCYWEQVFISYGVDRVIFVPKLMDARKPEQYDTLDEALANVSEPKVFFERAERARGIGREPIYLRDFQHPEDVVYIFGSTPTHNAKWVEEDDILVSIEIPSKGDMFAITVAGIVLYDREVKKNDC